LDMGRIVNNSSSCASLSIKMLLDYCIDNSSLVQKILLLSCYYVEFDILCSSTDELELSTLNRLFDWICLLHPTLFKYLLIQKEILHLEDFLCIQLFRQDHSIKDQILNHSTEFIEPLVNLLFNQGFFLLEINLHAYKIFDFKLMQLRVNNRINLLNLSKLLQYQIFYCTINKIHKLE